MPPYAANPPNTVFAAMNKQTQRLISTAGVAQLLGVSIRTVERLASEGRCGFPKAIKINGGNYYVPETIEAYKGRVSIRKSRVHPLELTIEL